jgi:hypothetical protein
MMPEIDPTVLLALIVGLLVDFDYAMTRLRGFGRLVISKIPVKPESDESR